MYIHVCVYSIYICAYTCIFTRPRFSHLFIFMLYLYYIYNNIHIDMYIYVYLSVSVYLYLFIYIYNQIATVVSLLQESATKGLPSMV